MKTIIFLIFAGLLTSCYDDENNDKSCKQNFTKCGNICTDILTDNNNCGACGNSCNGNSCDNGKCNSSCENSALHNCSGKCVAFGVDNENCGGCGIKCPDTHQCVAARCSLK